MKFDVVEFVSICLTCQKVKTDHPRPQGLLHQLHIPERKWKSIFMDFLCGFLRKPKGNNMILVIVERLKKVAHFITMKDTWSKHQPFMAYKRHVLKQYGVPKDIVFDRDARFLSNF